MLLLLIEKNDIERVTQNNDDATLMAQDAWFLIKFRKQPDGKLAKRIEMVRDPN